MLNRSLSLLSCGLMLPCAMAQAPQLTVVPSAYDQLDAVSHLWIAGACCDVRQQTLVGASHLTAMVGRQLTAIELRRTAANETYFGGVAQLVVTLSANAAQPLRCSKTFAANVGASPLQVFAGQVVLPSSPAEPGPRVGWTPSNTVRIAFQTPFVYTGGTLCIDVVGLAIPGQTANWWMADAMFEDLSGAATPRGNGCGPYGGPTGHWAHTSTGDLVPGAHANFFAYGPPNSLGVAAFGPASAAPIPLTLFGFPSPGCDLHLGAVDAMLPALFVPESDPGMYPSGRADVHLWIPDSAAVFGMTMTTQWFEWSHLVTSNAIEWTVAAALPTLDMAVIEGHPSEAIGNVSVHQGHILRFEHQ